MRVLSMSSDPSETDAKESPAKPGETTAKLPQATPQPPPPRKSSARKVLLKAFGVRTQDENEPSAQAVPAMAVAGMGKKLLSKMEGQDIGTQMREFYSSYSKVSTPTFFLFPPPHLAKRPLLTHPIHTTRSTS